jgi:hypothetical protein
MHETVVGKRVAELLALAAVVVATWAAAWAVGACGGDKPRHDAAPVHVHADEAPVPPEPPKPDKYPDDVTSLRLKRSIVVRFTPDAATWKPPRRRPSGSSCPSSSPTSSCPAPTRA